MSLSPSQSSASPCSCTSAETAVGALLKVHTLAVMTPGPDY